MKLSKYYTLQFVIFRFVILQLSLKYNIFICVLCFILFFILVPGNQSTRTQTQNLKLDPVCISHRVIIQFITICDEHKLNIIASVKNCVLSSRESSKIVVQTILESQFRITPCSQTHYSNCFQIKQHGFFSTFQIIIKLLFQHGTHVLVHSIQYCFIRILHAISQGARVSFKHLLV